MLYYLHKAKEKIMLDITNMKNKYNETAYNLEVKVSGKQPLHNYHYNFEIDLPNINSAIFVNYNFSRVSSYSILADESYEDISVLIKVGRQIMKLHEVTYPEDKFVEKRIRYFDINNFVRTICAYAYFKQNFKDLVLHGMTKRELKKLDNETLEIIAYFGQNAQRQFENQITNLCHGVKEKDAQTLVDSLFGEGMIDVDNLIETNINEVLARKEKEYEFANEILEVIRKTLYSDIKEGKIKTFVPFKMLRDRARGIKGKMLEYKNRRTFKNEENEYKKSLIENIEEQSKEL